MDDGYLYAVLNEGEILRLRTRDGERTRLAQARGASGFLALDADNVYWTSGGKQVWRVSKQGGEPFFLGQAGCELSIAVDARGLYCTDFRDAAISRLPL